MCVICERGDGWRLRDDCPLSSAMLLAGSSLLHSAASKGQSAGCSGQPATIRAAITVPRGGERGAAAVMCCPAASAASSSLSTASAAVSSSPGAAITMALMQHGRQTVADAHDADESQSHAHMTDSKEDAEQQKHDDDATSHPPPRRPSNLESYLASQAPPASAAPDAWLADDFTPVTTSLVQAVREIRLGDVKWFLRQMEIKNHAGRTTETTSPSSGGRSPTDNAAPSSSDVPAQPSPLLATLPASALSLPTSGPYIMDILFDSIVGLQAQLQLASVRTTKAANRRRAQQEKVELRLIDLLTPLPPVTPASITLPSPAHEDAIAIMQSLVRAVDVVGGTVLSSSACIDYLKLSGVPYPILKDNLADAAEAMILSPKSPDAVAADLSVGWSVTKEWTKRVQLLQQFGAVLDVNRTPEEEEGLASPAVAQRAAAAASNSSAASITPAALSVTQLHPVLLTTPPALSSFVHPPFALDSKPSQEKYLQHTYLSLLAKRQIFLQLLTDEVAAVKTARAQANSLLVSRTHELESRDSKIITDVAKFEAEKEALEVAAATATTQSQMDAIKMEQLERDTRATLEVEWRAHRESVAIRGARLVQRDEHELEQQFEEANARLQETRAESAQSMAAVEEARARLRDINLQYERVAIALESAQSRIDGVASRAAQMEGYVSAFETSVKHARKGLKETHVLVDQSRASTASLSVVELEMRGKGVWLLFGGPMQVGVSNLFLKFFRCMTGAPDPRDPNPEVVWDPEPCYVSELCSPSATRSLEQLRNPSWRTVKIDLWKLCVAENGRYFKIEVWDCDASVKAVANVVRGALDQAKNEANAAAQAAAQAAQAGLAESAPAVLNPDGTVQKTAPVSRGPVQVSSVTLPSTTAIKYAYIGQAVMTLQHLYDAQAKRESDASVSQGAGLYSVPIINAERWANRGSNPYTDSGTLIVQSMRVVEK